MSDVGHQARLCNNKQEQPMPRRRRSSRSRAVLRRASPRLWMSPPWRRRHRHAVGWHALPPHPYFRYVGFIHAQGRPSSRPVAEKAEGEKWRLRAEDTPRRPHGIHRGLGACHVPYNKYKFLMNISQGGLCRVLSRSRERRRRPPGSIAGNQGSPGSRGDRSASPASTSIRIHFSHP